MLKVTNIVNFNFNSYLIYLLDIQLNGLVEKD